MEKEGMKRERAESRGPRQGRRRPERRRSVLPVILVLLLLLLSGLGYGGYLYVSLYMPTKEAADLSEYFDVAGNNIQIFLNDEKQKNEKDYLVVGRYREGQAYLPYEFVLEKLNRRFYWQEDEEVFLYTLPEETKVWGEQDTLADGGAAFLRDGSKLYLNVTLVQEYTNIRVQKNTDGEYKQLFLYDSWESYPEAKLKKKEAVRLLGGVKSPVLEELAQGDSVKILRTLENWSYVLTRNGFRGYVRNKQLTEAETVTPESSFVAPVYTHLTLPEGEKVELGFHQVTTQAANEGLSALTADTAGMNVVAPTWFVLSGNEGDFVSYAGADYVGLAHEKGLQVWATVNNFDLGNVDESVLLKNRTLRGELISGLVQHALEYDIDGINVDFEALPESLGRDYVQFMREMSVACRHAGLILSADSYVPYDYNRFYDLEEIGTFCDYVIIMCYDEHYAGSETAGSVASISYVDRGITEATSVVAREQVIIAVPFYTRVWITENGKLRSEALGIRRARQWVQEKGVSLSWDDTVGQNVGAIEDNGAQKEIWMEDEDSMALKMSRIREAGVGGVAAWKLGLEPEGFWELLRLE